ncbi:type II restriction enzyme eco47ii protein [Marine Group I thaumarchaeote SCGC AAA799-E16]|uniref:Type II restriction enzyme eco47ii protein n=2 Tax=Marine Group I TaxID=905826 RepID=A0A087RXX8_9ARCH|nr:type II restriction enzyme eco47ii protein [Marine Group I thaumarchaeote SCGC AAA799-E16]KFM18332.1 type II restriction enzyme eco47ii protein [Marine Group I thaumarchaeote SCGC RSA3]
MPNKYVDFVSDEHFLKCVKWVCDAYLDPSLKLDKAWLQRNGVDPFKMVFDMVVRNRDFNSLIENEKTRQFDKKSGGRIGDFHQKLLGGVSGWTDLGVGDDSKVDLKKDDNTVFMELKNKYNTVNSDSKDSVRRKLKKITEVHPGSTAYWAYVIEKDGTSGESEWVHLGDNDPKIRKIWGSKLYEMITGKEDALEKTWVALPVAINDLISTTSPISSADVVELNEWFKDAFEK